MTLERAGPDQQHQWQVAGRPRQAAQHADRRRIQLVGVVDAEEHRPRPGTVVDPCKRVVGGMVAGRSAADQLLDDGEPLLCQALVAAR